MELLDVWQQHIQYDFNRLLEECDLGLSADYTDYVYVDGEEGDHGIVRYLDSAGKIVAVKTIFAGDDESLDVTDYGRKIVADKLTEAFATAISKMATISLDDAGNALNSPTETWSGS